MPYKDPEKQKEFQRNRLSARRRKWLEENGPCVICGSKEKLEVDHIDPATKVSHKVWSWSEKRLLEELKKCQVLCLEHHQQKSRLYYASLVKHGTLTMYNKYGCRCELCRELKRSKMEQSRNPSRKIKFKPRRDFKSEPSQPVDPIKFVLSLPNSSKLEHAADNRETLESYQVGGPSTSSVEVCASV